MILEYVELREIPLPGCTNQAVLLFLLSERLNILTQ